MVELRHLIKDFTIIGEALETVGEAWRNENLAAGLRSQFDGVPVPEGRRCGPNVRDDIKDNAGRAADKFGFRPGLSLIMQAANDATPLCAGEIALRPGRVQAVRSKLLRAEGSREETALVIPSLQVDDPNAAELSGVEFHRILTEGIGDINL